jgi:hypothetical protein
VDESLVQDDVFDGISVMVSKNVGKGSAGLLGWRIRGGVVWMSR